MKMFICGVAMIAGGVIAASAAQASITIATFSDPSSGNSAPMFTVDHGALTLTGGWSAPGLNLQTPNFPGGPYLNTHLVFSGTSLTVIPPAAPPAPFPSYQTSGGTFDFLQDVTNTVLLHISFSSGFLNATSFGSADFYGFNVVFSGAIPGYPVTDEDFAFGFTNQSLVSPGPYSYTASSSFTSSATIPAPGAATLLGIGGLVATRRRRR